MQNKDDDWFWELLEEQHNHDVVISGATEDEDIPGQMNIEDYVGETQ